MKKLNKCMMCGKTFVSYYDRKTCSAVCRYKLISKELAEKWQIQPWGRKSKPVERKCYKGPRTGIDKLLNKIFEG